MNRPDDPPSLLAWLAAAPDGTLVPVEAIRTALPLAERGAAPPRAVQLDTWRERLWSAPPETRIGVKELAAAVGHSASWVWKRTHAGAASRIPHRRVDGELVFVVGEVRAWLAARETPVDASPNVLSLAARRRGS